MRRTKTRAAGAGAPWIAAALIAATLPVLAAAQVVERRTPLADLGADAVMTLRGIAASDTVDFGSRSDELVTKATLTVRYSHSEALAAARGELRVTLNDAAIGLLPMREETAGTTVTRSFEVDPGLFVGSNRLRFSLAAPGAGTIERSSLWAEINGASDLALTIRPLTVADDLSQLPEPFFDKRDKRRLKLPVIFAAQPSLASVRAGGVVASWFGQLAVWRGARFPVALDEPVQGHAIVIATNTERPAVVANLPAVTGPTIRMMTNPADGRSKLLVILGRDGNDLKLAADGLVLGQAGMSGASALVKEVKQAARAPYDAPRWVRLDRPTKFADLLEWDTQLQASGQVPALDVVRLNLRAPPDFADLSGPGVPMKVKFRYTPPACAADAHLDVSVNGDLLRSIALRTALRPGEGFKPGPPLQEAIADEFETYLPMFRLRTRMQLQFVFRFEPLGTAECRDARATARAAIDSASTIDFTGLQHAVEMPQLGTFIASGYPFTRLADLSQTVVALPDKPAAQEIETLLTLLARMGDSTGVAATGLRVVSGTDEAALLDTDVLIITATPQNPLIEKWAASLPVTLHKAARRVSQPSRPMAMVYERLGLGNGKDAAALQQVTLEASGQLAMLLGFESPVTPGRSVVAVTALLPDQLSRVLDSLEDPDARKEMRGSAIIIHRSRVESLLVGPTYMIGSIPPWVTFENEVRARPILSAVVAGVLLAMLAYFGLRLKRTISPPRARRKDD